MPHRGSSECKSLDLKLRMNVELVSPATAFLIGALCTVGLIYRLRTHSSQRVYNLHRHISQLICIFYHAKSERRKLVGTKAAHQLGIIWDGCFPPILQVISTVGAAEHKNESPNLSQNLRLIKRHRPNQFFVLLKVYLKPK